jgi:hypothetical protein
VKAATFPICKRMPSICNDLTFNDFFITALNAVGV